MNKEEYHKLVDGFDAWFNDHVNELHFSEMGEDEIARAAFMEGAEQGIKMERKPIQVHALDHLVDDSKQGPGD